MNEKLMRHKVSYFKRGEVELGSFVESHFPILKMKVYTLYNVV